MLKIAGAGDAPGLQAAAWLNGRGLRTGAPVRTEMFGDRLVALLEFVEGRSLGTDDGDVDLVGETLGRAHTLLVGAPVPEDLDRWPWAMARPCRHRRARPARSGSPGDRRGRAHRPDDHARHPPRRSRAGGVPRVGRGRRPDRLGSGLSWAAAVRCRVSPDVRGAAGAGGVRALGPLGEDELAAVAGVPGVPVGRPGVVLRGPPASWRPDRDRRRRGQRKGPGRCPAGAARLGPHVHVIGERGLARAVRPGRGPARCSVAVVAREALPVARARRRWPASASYPGSTAAARHRRR